MAQRKTVAQAASKWQSRVAGAQQYYSDGVQNSKDWAAAALEAAPARNAALQAAISSGSIDRGISRVGTAGWRSKTLAKGPTAWMQAVSSPTGLQAYTSGLQRAYGYLDQADAAVSSLPRGGYANNRARMLAYIDAVHSASEAYKAGA